MFPRMRTLGCCLLVLMACRDAGLTTDGSAVAVISSDTLLHAGRGCTFRGVTVARDRVAIRNAVAEMGANTALVWYPEHRPLRAEAFACPH